MDDSSVTQDIVAELVVILPAATLDITGAVTSDVLNTSSLETASLLAPSILPSRSKLVMLCQNALFWLSWLS